MAERIEKAIASLAAMPTGRWRRVVGSYEKALPGLILELIPAGEETLAVLRMIHGARDWKEDQ